MKVESGFFFRGSFLEFSSRNEMEVVQHLSGWLPKEGQKALAPVSNKVSSFWKGDTKWRSPKNREWTEFLLRWTVKKNVFLRRSHVGVWYGKFWIT